MTGMSFLSFTFFFLNTSLQMNAYTAALSVALSNCCVLTSSCNSIQSKNGSLHERRLKRTLHSTDVQSFYSAKFWIKKWRSHSLQRLLFEPLFYFTVIALFNGYSLNGYIRKCTHPRVQVILDEKLLKVISDCWNLQKWMLFWFIDDFMIICFQNNESAFSIAVFLKWGFTYF